MRNYPECLLHCSNTSCKTLLSSILFIKINNHLTEICLIKLIIIVIIVEIIINYIYLGKKLETVSFVWYILKLSETLQVTWVDITFYNSCCHKDHLMFWLSSLSSSFIACIYAWVLMKKN